MAAIQGAINQALGSLGTAVSIGKHISEEKKQTDIAEQALKEQRAKEEMDIPLKQAQLQQEMSNVADKIGEEKKRQEAIKKGINPETLEYDPATKSYTGQYELNPDKKTINYNLKKSRESLNVLKASQAGMEFQKSQYEKRLAELKSIRERGDKK